MKLLQDVTRETGISYYTLVKYTNLGLIPKAKRIWRGRKGSQSLYPNDIVSTIWRIQSDKRDGLSLNEIAENRRRERARDVFARIVRNYPDVDFTDATITKHEESPDGEVRVMVELTGYKRR